MALSRGENRVLVARRSANGCLVPGALGRFFRTPADEVVRMALPIPVEELVGFDRGGDSRFVAGSVDREFRGPAARSVVDRNDRGRPRWRVPIRRRTGARVRGQPGTGLQDATTITFSTRFRPLWLSNNSRSTRSTVDRLVDCARAALNEMKMQTPGRGWPSLVPITGRVDARPDPVRP